MMLDVVEEVVVDDGQLCRVFIVVAFLSFDEELMLLDLEDELL